MNQTNALKKTELLVGKIYPHKNGEHYECIHYAHGNGYMMRNTKSNWTCTVYGVTRYTNGKIDWLYSCNGHFEEEKA